MSVFTSSWHYLGNTTHRHGSFDNAKVLLLAVLQSFKPFPIHFCLKHKSLPSENAHSWLFWLMSLLHQVTHFHIFSQRNLPRVGPTRQGFVYVVHLWVPSAWRTNWNILGVQSRWLEWLNEQIIECLNLYKYLIRFCLRTSTESVYEGTEGKNNISIY